MKRDIQGAPADITVDSILRGLLEFEQPRNGYRFNIDAILLAAFAAHHARRVPQVVDLGAGCGVVGLLMAHHWLDAAITLVELQPSLAALCTRNAARNSLAGRVRVARSDLREGGWRAESGGLLALCNPPFYRVGHGRLSSDPQEAIARHELQLTLRELFEAAASNLGRGEEVALVHLAGRGEEIFAALGVAGFGALRYRYTRSLPNREVQRILVVATKGASVEDRRDLGDLIINSAEGGYGAEVRALLEGEREPSGGD